MSFFLFTFDELLDSTSPAFNELPIYSNIYNSNTSTNSNSNKKVLKLKQKHGEFFKLSTLQGAYITAESGNLSNSSR